MEEFIEDEQTFTHKGQTVTGKYSSITGSILPKTFHVNENREIIIDDGSDIIDFQTKINNYDNYLVSIEYKKLRKKEYPPFEDYADAWVKKDNVALEEYRQACLDVKAKYPKP